MPANDVWLEVTSKVPNLIVLAGIVWMFLRHLKDRDQWMKSLDDESARRSELMRAVIEENTRAFSANAKLIDHAVDRMTQHRDRP